MYGIIWNNKDLTVFLVDIPGTIAAAQVLKLQRNDLHLLSVKPLTEVYRDIPEPKRVKGKARMEERVGPMTALAHEEHRMYATDALKQIKTALGGKIWCEDRYYCKSSRNQQIAKQGNDPDGDKGRMVCNSELSVDSYATDGAVMLKIPAKLMQFLAQGYPHYQEVEWPGLDETASFPEAFGSFFHNPRDDTLKLSCVPDKETAEKEQMHGLQKAYGPSVPAYQKAQCFRIPPAASFILANCRHGYRLQDAMHHMCRQYGHPKHFDLIIMDPPWPNASVKSNGIYETFVRVEHMDRMFDAMDLDARIAPGGVIGVWITNAEKVRRYVLGPDGLFAKWGVALFEEWVWVKTTVDGTPVIPVDSAFRKPWECLLLGQAPDTRGVRWPPVGDWPVNRRVIVAVPDLHSRKPCLKPIIEKIWQKAEGQYTALEIFGRVAVAGWWTWGNEAIKFNWERYWITDGEESDEVERWVGEEYLSQLDLTASAGARGEEESAASETVGLKRKASSLE